MNTPLFIARKYFLSGKKKNFINVISLISMGAVALASLALVVALSVFNGLEQFIIYQFSTFDPDLKVVPATGKSFIFSDSLQKKMEEVPGVEVITPVIEDNAYVRYRESEMVVKIKGVEESFFRQNNMVNHLVLGKPALKSDSVYRAIMGYGVFASLSVAFEDEFTPLQIYYPRAIRAGMLNPARALTRKSVMPGAIFNIEKQYDENYIFVHLELARELMRYGEKRSYIEVKTKGSKIKEVQESMQQALGPDFDVLTREQQHASLLRAIKIEKLFVYLTLSFILAISSFNIFFALTMLAIEKKKDISILFAMGASKGFIRWIFLLEGAIIAFSGAIAGLVLGFLLVILQLYFGFVPLGMDTAVMTAYPVKIEVLDFIATAGVIILITLVASSRPAAIASRMQKVEYL